jgi:hypothetical protein
LLITGFDSEINQLRFEPLEKAFRAADDIARSRLPESAVRAALEKLHSVYLESEHEGSPSQKSDLAFLRMLVDKHRTLGDLVKPAEEWFRRGRELWSANFPPDM